MTSATSCTLRVVKRVQQKATKYQSHQVRHILQTGLTGTEKIGKLLDVIPTRGPDAFDRFCEALLACAHAHVAEYLKTLEGTVTS